MTDRKPVAKVHIVFEHKIWPDNTFDKMSLDDYYWLIDTGLTVVCYDNSKVMETVECAYALGHNVEVVYCD